MFSKTRDMTLGLFKRSFLIASMFLLGCAPVFADTLYKCTDDSGVVLYTNQKGAAKKCTILSRDQPISTFTAPKQAPRAATPNDFPRVDSGTQRGRDSDRRKILEQELGAELQNLEISKKDFAEQAATILPQEKNAGGSVNQARIQERIDASRSKVRLHERNIEALKSELVNLK